MSLILPAAAATKKLNGLELRQSSRAYGTLNVFLNKEVLRIKLGNQNRYLLAWAPHWQVYAVNDSTRSYVKGKNGKLDLIMQRVMLMEGGDLSKCQWAPVHNGFVAGHPAIKLAEKGQRHDQQIIETSRARGYENIADEIRLEGFWVATEKVSLQAANTLASITGMPQTGKLPLRFIHMTSTMHEPLTVLDTTSFKTGTLDEKLTRLPVNYKESISEYDTTVDSLRTFFDNGK